MHSKRSVFDRGRSHAILIRHVVYALQARRCCVRVFGLDGLALAPLAQSAERLHGKEKVYGSIP